MDLFYIHPVQIRTFLQFHLFFIIIKHGIIILVHEKRFVFPLLLREPRRISPYNRKQWKFDTFELDFFKTGKLKNKIIKKFISPFRQFLVRRPG